MTAITSKGQVTVPKRVRDALGLKPGSKVAFEYRGGGEAIIRRAGRAPRNRFSAVRGSLGRKKSTDEIMALLRGD
ncbi:MAG TPA: type II toxin-antitoxin system PrlF family antitoxin [Rhizomicrobium sp.]